MELMMYLVPHLPFHNSISPPFFYLLPTVSNPPVKGHHIPSQDQATWSRPRT